MHSSISAVQVLSTPRPLNWRFEHDLQLLCRHWLAEGGGELPKPQHIPGHDHSSTQRRLGELKAALPPDVFDLWPRAAPEERKAVLATVQRLATPAGRHELVRLWEAEQQAEQEDEVERAATGFAHELARSYDPDGVDNLVLALRAMHDKQASAFTLADDLELIAKVHRCRGTALRQKDITVGAHAADDGCKHRLALLRAHLPSGLVATYLPTRPTGSAIEMERAQTHRFELATLHAHEPANVDALVAELQVLHASHKGGFTCADERSVGLRGPGEHSGDGKGGVVPSIRASGCAYVRFSKLLLHSEISDLFGEPTRASQKGRARR